MAHNPSSIRRFGDAAGAVLAFALMALFILAALCIYDVPPMDREKHEIGERP